jgi:hypothetical protein
MPGWKYPVRASVKRFEDAAGAGHHPWWRLFNKWAEVSRIEDACQTKKIEFEDENSGLRKQEECVKNGVKPDMA